MKDVVIITVVVSESDIQHYAVCLNSIIKHPTTCDIEIWVVDNTKKESSVSILAKKYPNLKVLKNNDISGFSANNNKVIASTESKYVFLLNPDIILEDGTIDIFFKYMEDNTDAAIVSCKHVNENGIPYGSSNSFPTVLTTIIQMLKLKRLIPVSTIKAMARWSWTRILGKSIRTHLDNFDENKDVTREVDCVGGAAMFVRRSLIDKVGMLDENFFLYFEDIDWCYRIKMHGYKIVHLSGISLTHVSGEKRDLPDSDLVTIEKVKSTLLYFNKHKSALYSIVVRISAIASLILRLIFELFTFPFQSNRGSLKTTIMMLKVCFGIG